MHPPTDLREFFDGPWGILESRRKEIEDGSFGTYERVLDEEVKKKFYNLEAVADEMQVHWTTARRWMVDCECRYIIHQRTAFFEIEDVERIIKLRKEIQEKRRKKNVG